MVYKKYIYKKGKKFGPYYYESYREGDKVKKRYIGTDFPLQAENSSNVNKVHYLFIILGVLALAIVGFYFLNFYTGRVVLQLEDSYSIGEKISGNLNFFLKNGELIPANSFLKIKLGNQEKTISLNELTTNEKVSGDFYAENANLQGQGEGFGVVGTRTIYPDVDFILLILKNEEEQTPTPVTETPTETTTETTETTTETPAQVPSETPVVESSPAPSESSPVESIPVESAEPAPEPSPITGQAIKENSNKIEIQAKVSKNQVFTYTLGEGELAEIKQNSVEVEGKKIDDNLINLNQQGTNVEVTTSYQIEEQGFGQEYLQDETLKLEINLEQFGIIAEQGTLEVSLVYQDTEIIKTSEEILVEQAQENETETIEIPDVLGDNETMETNITFENETIEIPADSNVSNSSLYLIQEMPDLILTRNETKIINLNEYFANADNYYAETKLAIELNESILVIPALEIANETLNISAFKGNETISDAFNVIIQEQGNLTNLTIETIQYSAVINKPVRWKKIIFKSEDENFTIELPKDTSNISVKKIEKQDKEEITEEIENPGITGSVVGSRAVNWLKNIFRFTGRAVGELENLTRENVIVEIPENSSQVEIEYYTPAPEAVEENITNGKRITISSPELNYTNVLAYTDIPENWNITNTENIRLTWIEDNNESLKQSWHFDIFDDNNDSLIDYIEWNVPHLSNQTFELNNLSASSVSSNIKCENGGQYCHLAVNDSSLVLYMPFDVNASSTTTEDWSRYNNTGIFQGNAHLNSTGKYGWGLKLDGTGDYVNVSASSSLNILGPVTIAAWIYPRSTAGDILVISKVYYNGGDNGGYSLRKNNAGWEFNIANNVWGWVYEADGASLNQWQHVVGVYDGSVTLKLYINGVLQTVDEAGDSRSDAPTSIKSVTQPLGLGYVENSMFWPNYFDGSLDEVMIFNRSLSDAEILNFYNSQFPRFVSSGNLTLNRTITSGHSDVEITTYNNNQQSTNVSLSLCYSANCTPSQNMTNGTRQTFLISDSTTLLYMNFSFVPDSYSFFSPILLTNVSINVFGETYPKFSLTNPTPPSGVNNSQNHLINLSIFDSSLLNFSFNWNSTNYSFYDESLLLMYNFDNRSALGENYTYAADSSLYKNNATILGAVVSNSGKYFSALSFDGVNDYLNLGDIALLENLNFTIEMWVYPKLNARNHEDGLIAKTDTAFYGYSFYVGNQPSALTTKNVQFLYGDSGAWRYTTGTSVLADNRWYHLVVSYNHKNVSIYVNGTLEKSEVFANALAVDTNAPIVIGQGWQDNNRFWNGSIDELKIWSRSLTGNEISQLYKSSLNKYNSSLWQFTSNQSNLNYGSNHTYQAFAKNSLGLTNSTEFRGLNITSYVYPIITLLAPLNQTYPTSSILFNLTLPNNIDTCRFTLDNWLTNYSMSNVTLTNFNYTNSSILDGGYTAKFWCNNSDNIVNDTVQVSFSVDSVFPLIYFSNPTPDSGVTSNNNQTINLTFQDANIKEFKWNWNGTNYTIFNSNLTLFYNFDNRSALGENDTYIVDNSLHLNHGIISGSPFFSSSGVYDGSLNFDGVNDYITVNPTISQYLTSNFSVFFWIKVVGSTTDQEILMKRNNTGTNYQFFIAKGQDGCGNKYNFGFWNGVTLACGNTALTLNRWYFVGFVLNATGTTFYINDTKDATANIIAGTFNPPLIIGSADPTEVGTSYDFNGSLDNLMFFNKTFNQDEVSQVYKANLAKFSSTLWRFSSNQSGLIYEQNYTYQAFVKDFAGNANLTVTRELNVSAALVVTIKSPTNITYTTHSILFNITSNNPANTCKFTLDNWATNYSMTSTTTTNFDYVNSSVPDANYLAKFWCNDSANRIDSSQQVNFSVNTIGSNIFFTNPTPPSGVNYTTSHIFNVTLIESNLTEFIWDWNGTNYSIYDKNLIAMYGFNNISAIGDNYTYAADSSLYGYGGVLSGNTVWNCSFRKYGCSAEFDGADDWVTLPVYKGIYNISHLSVCAWAYKRVNVTFASLVSDYVNGGGGRNFILGYEGSPGHLMGTLAFGIGDGDSLEWVYNSGFTESRWHYVCGVYNNDTRELSLYIDGINETVTTLVVNKTGRSSTGSSGGFIGTLYGAGGYDFNGLIDEVRIWNKSLSSQDVNEMYNSNLYKYNLSLWYFESNHSNLINGQNYTYQAFATNLPGIENSTEIRELNISSGGVVTVIDTLPPSINFTNPTPADLSNQNETSIYVNVSSSDSSEYYVVNNFDNSLVGWWRFENAAAGSGGVKDEFGLSNGTISGGAVQNLSGKYNSSMSFDGGYINFGSGVNLNITNELTISTWIKPAKSQTQTILNRGNSGSGCGYLFYAFGGSLAFYSCGIFAWQTSSSTISVNQWSHAVVTFSNSKANNLTFYINGVPSGSYIGSNRLDGSYSGNFEIGLDDGSWPFSGSIDDVMIFNRSLSSNEILALYNATANQYYNNFTNLSYGNHSMKAYAVDSSGNINSTETRNVQINFPPDITAPYFTSIPDEIQVTYEGNLGVDFNASDNTAFESFAVNYTSDFQIGISSGLLENKTLLGVGSYAINITINDSSNNINSTIWHFNVTQASQFINSLLNGATTNLTVPYATPINSSFSGTNYTALTINISNFFPISGLNYTYGVGSYLVNYSAMTEQNHTGYYYLLNFTITPASQTATLVINETSPLIYGRYINVTCNGQLYRDNANITDELAKSILLGNGTYNYACIKFSDGNYSYDDDNLTFQVLKATPTITLLINDSASNQTALQGTQTNVSAYVDNTEQTIVLLNNSVTATASNGLYYTYKNSSYNFTAYVIETQNYSYATLTRWVHIFNDSVEDITPPYVAWIQPVNITYLQSNVTINISSTGDYTWWFNGTANNSYSSELELNLTNGQYTWIAYANDSYNKINSTTITFVVNYTLLDTTSPEITLINPANATSSTTSGYNFTFNVSDSSEIANCSLNIANSITMNSSSISKTDTNGIYKSGLGVASYIWYINCTDVFGNTGSSLFRTLTVESTSVTPVTPPAGGGGGGGGGSDIGFFKLEANPNVINLQTVVGRIINSSFILSNLGSFKVYLVVATPQLENIIQMNKSVDLESGEARPINFKIIAPDTPGIYTGKIQFIYGENVFEVPVMLNVKSEASLFDISVNLPLGYKSISQGNKLKAQINLLQAGLQEKADVTVVYLIKDFEENTYIKESETLMVDKEKTYEKEFQTQTLGIGDYIVGAEVIYSGGVATASSNFKVVEKKPFSFWILLIVIVVFIIAIIVAVRYKKRAADIINNNRRVKKR